VLPEEITAWSESPQSRAARGSDDGAKLFFSHLLSTAYEPIAKLLLHQINFLSPQIDAHLLHRIDEDTSALADATCAGEPARPPGAGCTWASPPWPPQNTPTSCAMSFMRASKDKHVQRSKEEPGACEVQRVSCSFSVSADYMFIHVFASPSTATCLGDTDTRIGIGRIRIHGYADFPKNPIHRYV